MKKRNRKQYGKNCHKSTGRCGQQIMKKKKDPQIDWEEIIFNICYKAIIPVAILWAVVGCVSVILCFTS